MPDGDAQSTQETTDEQLVAKLREGSDEAFSTLMQRYERELYHFLLRFVNDRALAEDLFQETFLQVYQSADTFDITRRFRPWLFTIGANKARDYLRRLSSRGRPIALSTQIGKDGDGRTLVDLMEDDLPLPTETVQQGEIEDLVRETIEEMPDHLREILLLAYFEQFPYKEIADVLGIPLGTVKSRLHSAVGTFAELWKHRHGNGEIES